MGDGGAEKSSATRDRGQAATSLTPDIDGMHVCNFECSQHKCSYVGDLVYSGISWIPRFLGFPCGSAGKEPACNAGNLGLIPGLGRSPGERKSYPLQYSGLENHKELDMTERLSLHFTLDLWRMAPSEGYACYVSTLLLRDEIN